MKQAAAILLTIFLTLGSAMHADAQLIERAENLIRAALSEARADSLPAGENSTESIEERIRRDSLRLEELEM